MVRSTLLITGMLCLFVATALAVVPNTIMVQGKVTDASDVPLPAGTKTFTFRIFDAATLGTRVWPNAPAGEILQITTNQEGLWSAQLGAFHLFVNTPAVFADSGRWLEINVDGTTLPRVPIETVPYAFRVRTVDGASGGNITSKVSIGPGHTNTGVNSFVAGESNAATGDRSGVVGGLGNYASGTNSGALGGIDNSATGVEAVTIGGSSNIASGQLSAVVGGESNRAGSYYSAVIGGSSNEADTTSAAVIGGDFNTASGYASAVIGGIEDTASGQGATVIGGSGNTASGLNAIVAGGNGNLAAGENSFAAGQFDTASGNQATVTGGMGNTASGLNAIVAGGNGNLASGAYSSAAGKFDTASGYGSTIIGGAFNKASGDYSTASGYVNRAQGVSSFAAGQLAHALHDNTFVWNDSYLNNFASTAPNQFLIHASGGVGIGDVPNASTVLKLGSDRLYALWAPSYAINGTGVAGVADNGPGAIGVYGYSATGHAGYFVGKVHIAGTLSKSAGSFKIDHPLDPANKYLSHSFVESPDMMNIYSGNIVTDSKGNATVTMPDWFDVLNKDFRYQLTAIGQFAQAIVSKKIAGNQFSIKTDKPNVEVSWQVTGVRQDAYANAYRIPVEEAKPEMERGFYQHPELFGQPEEKSVEWARKPEMMKQMKEGREKAQAERDR